MISKVGNGKWSDNKVAEKGEAFEGKNRQKRKNSNKLDEDLRRRYKSEGRTGKKKTNRSTTKYKNSSKRAGEPWRRINKKTPERKAPRAVV